MAKKMLGKYELQEKLGEGTYAEVFRAINTALGNTVALKVLRSEMMTVEAFGRFRQEAQAASGLDHSQIVDVIDMDEAGGSYFLVMRYVEGPSLAGMLEQRGALPWGEALDIAQQTAAALDFAHQKGLVHRDVKPSNILVSAEKGAVLTDFGLVKAIEAGAKKTRSGMIPGTPQYTPPEIWDGQEASPASDQYALACVVCEMLTGETLFDGPTPYAVMKKHSTTPQFPKKWPKGVPEGVQALLAKGLAMLPEERFASCGEFVTALAGKSDQQESKPVAQTLVKMAQELEKGRNYAGALRTYRRALDQCTPGSSQALEVEAAIKRLERRHVSAVNPAKPAAARADQASETKTQQGRAVAPVRRTPAEVDAPLRSMIPAAAPKSGKTELVADPNDGVRLRSARKPWYTRWTIWVGAAVLGAACLIGVTAIGVGLWEIGSGSAEQTTYRFATTPPPTADITPTTDETEESTTDKPTELAPSGQDIRGMVEVPAGKFGMGSTNGNGIIDSDEEPIHYVYINKFWIDRTEVTNAMFVAFIEATGYETEAESTGWSHVIDIDGNEERVENADWQHPTGPISAIKGLEERPVVHVSWYDARAYCEWAGTRLPTEAEWEKATGSTDGRTYPWGDYDVAGNLLNYADTNHDSSIADKSENDGYRFTAPVGIYPDGASPYGALDMAGNVSEWVADRYSSGYYEDSPDSNPPGPSWGNYRVVRGGSWADQKNDVRSTSRQSENPSYSWNNLGFRCASSTAPQ
jgi:formylglycine-generating enzyme required for sulfatase activity